MTRIERASGLAVGQVREQTQCFQTLFDRRISKWFFPNMLQSIWVAISERQAARSKHEMCQYLLSKHSTLYSHTRHTTKIRNETTEWTNASSSCIKHSNSKGLPRRKDARHHQEDLPQLRKKNKALRDRLETWKDETGNLRARRHWLPTARRCIKNTTRGAYWMPGANLNRKSTDD